MHINGNVSAQLCQSVCKTVSESCQLCAEHGGHKLSQFCKFGKYKHTACFGVRCTDCLTDFWATHLTETSIINRNVPTNKHLGWAVWIRNVELFNGGAFVTLRPTPKLRNSRCYVNISWVHFPISIVVEVSVCFIEVKTTEQQWESRQRYPNCLAHTSLSMSFQSNEEAASRSTH